MTTTAIVDFTLAAGRPYRITVSPGSPKAGDALAVLIDSQDAWTLLSVYGGLGPKIVQPAQTYEEVIDLAGAALLPTTAPIASLTSAVCDSPLVDVENEVINESAGATIKPRLAVKNGALYIDQTGLYGSVRIKYLGFPAQTWVHDALPEAGQYVLFAKNTNDGTVEQVVVNVAGADAAESSQPSIVTVQAKDFCSDLPIPGAAIYVNGLFKGFADSLGKLVVGLLNPNVYTLKITAAGYTASDADELANDSFKI